MRVESILQAKGSRVETMEPKSTIAGVIHRLTSQRIGAIVVSKNGKSVDGIVSESDIVQALDRFGNALNEMHARDVMSSVPTCSPDDPIVEAMSKMTHSRSRHLPVVRNGMLCGIISLGDVVKQRLEELELQNNVVKHRLEELELQNNVLTDQYIAGRAAR